MPSGFATSMIALVMSMSAREASDRRRDGCAPTDSGRYCIDVSKYFQSSRLAGDGDWGR